MLCPHCGTENPDTSTICSNYSESLSDSTDSADSSDSADGIDSTDGTDSPDSGVKHDEDNDSGSEAEPDDGDNLNEQADSSTAEPDDPPVFSPPTMSPFIEEDFGSSIFRPGLTSDIDYSQFNVVTASTGTEHTNAPIAFKIPLPNKTIKIIGIAVLAATLCIALASGIWSLAISQQSSATKFEVQKLEESYQSQVDGIDVSPTEDSSRTDLLATYQDLADIQSKIDDDQAAGKFKFSDGSNDPDLVAVTSSISDKQKKIVDWFSSDYKKRLTASSFDEADSADTLDQETIDSRISALKNLQTDIENERVIWGGNTGKGSDYSSYVNRITEQIARGNKLSKELQKKNQASAHNTEKSGQPSKKAQDKWVGTYSGMGTDGLSLEIVLGSDGSVVYREGGTKVTNGSWTGDENSAQISFGGQVSSASEPFTITSSNGGKHIAVSSDSPSWNTDYLDKQ
ncbi:zinc ribbon domain-containing protein [Lancefieldella rimae]|uniref:zinc ribbon domain-containing protein n=1 Tax=Lancefieldella rimae TaxID=1383 RepID=UPI00288073A8|nr:zinc ribbon domain-containing protein [Lancefieldella rimae]